MILSMAISLKVALARQCHDIVSQWSAIDTSQDLFQVVATHSANVSQCYRPDQDELTLMKSAQLNVGGRHQLARVSQCHASVSQCNARGSLEDWWQAAVRICQSVSCFCQSVKCYQIIKGSVAGGNKSFNGVKVLPGLYLQSKTGTCQSVQCCCQSVVCKSHTLWVLG